MGDADENNKEAASVPSWQQAASQSQPAEDSSPETPSSDTILDRARIFLQDEEVTNASIEKKVEFLKSKGLGEEDIAKLLDESTQSTTAVTTTTTTEPTINTSQTQPSSPEPADLNSSSPNTQPGLPPIVTYPEFLTRPTKPPPLITPSGLLNALTLIGGASTLAYGATKHLVSPMVASLTAARADLHQAANANLSRLVGALQSAVSEIPASYYNTSGSSSKKPTASTATTAPAEEKCDDDESTYDDPSELFHRDVGVQTSPPAPSTPLFSSHLSLSNHSYNNSKPADPGEQTQHQADRLARLSVAGRALAADLVRQSEDLAETKNVLDAFGSDLHALTYPSESFAGGSAYLYGAAARSEPDDEIKRVKTNIRGVKGVLLSTRSFPATTR